MPYTLDWEPKGVYWEYSGDVSGAEIIEASTAIYGDPRFDELNYKLVNFLKITSFDVQKMDIMMIASQHKAAALSNRRIKTAIVVNEPSPLLDAFIAQLSNSPWEVKAFNCLVEASTWLGRKFIPQFAD